MTAPNESLEEKRQRVYDDAWRAWMRLGVSPLISDPPSRLEQLARDVGKAIVRPTLDLLDEMRLDLDEEAELRVLTAGGTGIVGSAVYQIAKAIADEVARPEPVPFAPPPAGSWVRGRYLRSSSSRRARKPDTGPRWDGAWHLFSGDWRMDKRSLWVYGRPRCGLDVRLQDAATNRDSYFDYVTADGRPAVDACGRCRRIAEKVPA